MIWNAKNPQNFKDFRSFSVINGVAEVAKVAYNDAPVSVTESLQKEDLILKQLTMDNILPMPGWSFGTTHDRVHELRFVSFRFVSSILHTKFLKMIFENGWTLFFHKNYRFICRVPNHISPQQLSFCISECIFRLIDTIIR